MTNRKWHIGFILTPRSMTLDDLELYKFEFSENFSGFRRFRTQQQLNEWRLASIVSDNVVSTSNWSNFWHAFALRGFVSDSWAFLLIKKMLKVTSLSLHTRLELHLPLVNYVIDDALRQTWPRVDETLFQLTDVVDRSLVNTLLHHTAVGVGQSHVHGVQAHCLAGTQTRRLQSDAWLAACCVRK